MKYIHIVFVFFLLTASISCTDEEPILPEKLDPVAKEKVSINHWIYTTMKEVYYWTDQIPSAVDSVKDPVEFFKGLLSPEDRFSVIVPDYEELINSLSGVSKEAGYEFVLTREDGTENVLATILYVKKHSPADNAGLKRGDVIHQINGVSITMSNYRSLVGEIDNDHTISYRRFNEQLGNYEDQGNNDLSAVVLAENPHHLDTVYSTKFGKIGYFVYNFFSPGTEGSTIYDDQMDQIFADFKNEGINSLILDLRYNSGGAVTSAKNLASLIGTGVDNTQIFYKNQFNENYQKYFENQPNGGAHLEVPFLNKPENIGNQLNGELYILTGSRTASASELIINGLDPYMNVTIIGDTTVGKNVGSIAIQDTENPQNNYGLLPIIFKIFNSQNFSDYDEGFTPLGENHINDFQMPLEALGDLEEPLLARAVELITGIPSSARKADIREEFVEPIMTSIDLKVRSNKLVIEKAE